MRYPAFLAELAHEQYRERLRFSVISGFTLAGVFGVLATAGASLGMVRASPVYFVPIGLKLATNTLSWASLRARRLVLEAAGLNVFMDVLAMTWAIYLTGAVLSPLLGIYGIELTVVALLSNLGVTVLVMALAIVLYGAMVIAVHVGALPFFPPPAMTLTEVTPGYLALQMAVVMLIVAVPTFFVASMLRQLRGRARALEERTNELLEASRERSQFMANVTHELRTPIHGICGLSQLVESGIYGELTDKQRFAQTEIQRSARSLLQLVDDLLELARTDAGRMTLTIVSVDLPPLLGQTLGSARAVLGTKQLELDLEVEAGLPPVRTDRAKLVHVLLNLLVNAIKFTPEGGSVKLLARRRGDDVVVAVEDTGIGIPEHEIPHLFEAFRQVDGSAEREHGGVGLGLAIVSRLVDAIGARVDVRSKVGAGSTFEVTLPTVPAEDRRATTAA